MKIKLHFLFIYTILLAIAFANGKSEIKLDKVEIDDLFYNNKKDTKTNIEQTLDKTLIDNILINNEDLELESLEIADIDIATFGEYENFLNKYYDENFSNLYRQSIRQIKITGGGSFASKLPFGSNAKASMNNGFSIGFKLNNVHEFYIGKRKSSIDLNFNLSSNSHRIYTENKWNFLHFNSTLETNLYGSLSSQIGLGILSARFTGSNVNQFSPGYGIFAGLNYNFKLSEKITLTFFGRGTLEKTFDDIPMFNNGASVEQLEFGISTSMPVYIQY